MPVIDASVWVAAFHKADIFHDRAIRVLEKFLIEDVLVRVPSIVFAEVGGSIRRRTNNTKLALTALVKMRAYDLNIREIDEAFAEMAADVAARIGLRGADAFYIALAKETGDTLWTFDEEQRLKGSAEAETKQP